MFDENVDKRTYAMKDSELLKRLLAYSKPYWFQFVIIFVMLFIASYAITEQPLYIGQAIAIVSDTAGFDFSLIMNIVYRLIVVIVIYNVFSPADWISSFIPPYSYRSRHIAGANNIHASIIIHICYLNTM